MAQVLPSILARDEQEFRKKVAAMAPLAPAVHIDALDGSLYPERSFSNPQKIGSMHLTIPFEAHLMTFCTEANVASWLKAGARRLIFHAQALGGSTALLAYVGRRLKSAGIALDPETGTDTLETYRGFFDHVLVMGVVPGAMGRAFDDRAIAKVREIRTRFPGVTIAVDGGVSAKKHLAKTLVHAGASELVAGSAIWNSPHPTAAYHDLVADANS